MKFLSALGIIIKGSFFIEDTRRDLGWAPGTSIAEGLGFFAKWFKRYYKKTGM
jgi:nucleoside-diphosphate-sugar epimerase